MLTDTAIRKAKPKEKPYKVSDSQGLYLLVNPKGSKLWRVKYRMNGVERKLALGSYPEITLAEARSARDTARRQLAHSIDPNFVKRQERIEAGIRASNSFSSVAQELIEKKAREGMAEPTLAKMRWFVKLLGNDYGKRPVAEITRRNCCTNYESTSVGADWRPQISCAPLPVECSAMQLRRRGRSAIRLNC